MNGGWIAMTLIPFVISLIKGYLRVGAGVCGPPALDREFGTTDFLVLLDTAPLAAPLRKRAIIVPVTLTYKSIEEKPVSACQSGSGLLVRRHEFCETLLETAVAAGR